MSFTFVHAAEIHLDSPLRGLERYESAPADRMRLATREAFENLVQYCVTEKVDFLLLAGDLYDGDWGTTTRATSSSGRWHSFGTQGFSNTESLIPRLYRPGASV